MNELLAQLRAAADNLHAALVVWENHIDHPGARTAIHSAARELLNAVSVMPTHYDDGSERTERTNTMTDHLTNARACLSRVDQAATHFSEVAWLTATCEHILDHLEAQQTEASLRRGFADITAGRIVDLGSFAQPVTAQPAAQQGDIHPDDDPIKCCWKRAVFDVQSTLDRADQIERGE